MRSPAQRASPPLAWPMSTASERSLKDHYRPYPRHRGPDRGPRQRRTSGDGAPSCGLATSSASRPGIATSLGTRLPSPWGLRLSDLQVACRRDASDGRRPEVGAGAWCELGLRQCRNRPACGRAGLALLRQMATGSSRHRPLGFSGIVRRFILDEDQFPKAPIACAPPCASSMAEPRRRTDQDGCCATRCEPWPPAARRARTAACRSARVSSCRSSPEDDWSAIQSRHGMRRGCRQSCRRGRSS